MLGLCNLWFLKTIIEKSFPSNRKDLDRVFWKFLELLRLWVRDCHVSTCIQATCIMLRGIMTSFLFGDYVLKRCVYGCQIGKGLDMTIMLNCVNSIDSEPPEDQSTLWVCLGRIMEAWSWFLSISGASPLSLWCWCPAPSPSSHELSFFVPAMFFCYVLSFSLGASWLQNQSPETVRKIKPLLLQIMGVRYCILALQNLINIFCIMDLLFQN